MKQNSKVQKECSCISSTLSLIGGKYSSSVLYLLANHDGSIRFNELKHSIGDIPCKTLSSTLKMMEEDELLLRTEYPQVPPRVEYSLTEKGRSLLPVLEAMCGWATHHSV